MRLSLALALSAAPRAAAVAAAAAPRVTLAALARKHAALEPIVVLTAYDAPTASLADAHADVLLVGDSVGMVVHGRASTVRVSLDGAPVGEATAAAASGLWRLALPPTPPALAPRALAFACSTGEQLALADVLFGHVLLNAGQSNACFTVGQAMNASAEAADSSRFASGLRVATVAHTHADAPQLELPDGLMQAWTPVSAAALEGGNFSYQSAVGYFAARGIFSALGEREPVGVITSCVSGTPIQAWSSTDAEAACDGTLPEPGQLPYNSLFNSMLAPFAVAPSEVPLPPRRLPFGRGAYTPRHSPHPSHPRLPWHSRLPAPVAAFSQVLWTQGEDNADQPAYYSCALPAFIADLRAKLAQPTLPFAFYLLAPWVKSGANFSALPLTRLAQLFNTSTLVNVAVAPAHDLGDPSTPWPGHPRFKQAVGARFAAVALAGAAFNASASPPWLAPRFESSSLSADGRAVTVSFASSGLAASCGGRLVLNLSVACPTAEGVPAAVCEGFAVQDADGAWVAAATDGSGAGPLSVALGDDGASVVLTLPPSAPAPARMSRGFFADWPVVTLRNCAGWPALPWLAAADA